MSQVSVPITSLLERHPVMSTDAMLAHFVPPPQFESASLDSYVLTRPTLSG